MENLRKAMNDSAEAQQKKTEENFFHQSRIQENLKEAAVKEITDRMNAAAQAAAEVADVLLKKLLGEQEAKLRKEKENEFEAQFKMNESTRIEITENFNREFSSLQQQFDDLQKQLFASLDESKSLNKLISAERTERQKREEGFIVDKDQMMREHDTEIRKERELCERKVYLINHFL